MPLADPAAVAAYPSGAVAIAEAGQDAVRLLFSSPLTSTTTITSTTPDPVVGEPIAIGVKVAAQQPSGLGLPQPYGGARVTDGQRTCEASLSGSNGIASGSCTITEDAVGAYAFTASYPGDTNLDPSATTSGAPVTVGKASSRTRLDLSPLTTTYGEEQLERLSVTVSPEYAGPQPTGVVTIAAGTTRLCVMTLSGATGSCSLTADQLAVGSTQLVASYGGSIDFGGSTSATESLTLWLAAADGMVFAAGSAPTFSGAHVPSSDPVVGIAATDNGKGYWLVTADGWIITAGDAVNYGSLPGLGVKVHDIVAIAPTTDSRGYWLIGADGGEFAFGDAKYHGSVPGLGLKVDDIVGMVATPSGAGYLIVGDDGGVFAFGATHFYGSLPGLGVKVDDICGILPAPLGTGYILVGTNGGAYVFGHGTPYHGSLPQIGVAVNDVVSIALTPSAGGYWMAGADGRLYPFGNAKNLQVSSSVKDHLPVAGIATS
jgi:hypothetical protein